MFFYWQQNYTSTCSTAYWVLNFLQVIIWSYYHSIFANLIFECYISWKKKKFVAYFTCYCADSNLIWGNCIWGNCIIHREKSISFHRRPRERIYSYPTNHLLCYCLTGWRTRWIVGTRRRIHVGSAFSGARSPSSSEFQILVL